MRPPHHHHPKLLKQGWKAESLLVIPLFGPDVPTGMRGLGMGDEGTSPFQPPLSIVSTNNGANKEPLRLT